MKTQTLIALIALLLLSACETTSERMEREKGQHDTLSRYVNEPLDKANAAAAAVEDRDEQLKRQLEAIGE